MEMHTDKPEKETKGIKAPRSWSEIIVPERVDAFTYTEFKSHIEEQIKKENSFIALNCLQTDFLSLLTIKFIVGVAEQLQSGKGQMALYGASEKIKRQISIYATTEPLMVIQDLGRMQ